MRPRTTRRVVRFLLAIASVAPSLATAQNERPIAHVLETADRAWAAQDFDAAFSHYDQVVRRDSTSGRALFRLATLLSWRNELERSLRLFREYARLEPLDDDGRVAIGRVLAWSGRYAESMATYDSVLARNPEHRDAALGAAQALAWSGRHATAVARYESWVGEHPEDPDAWNGLAQVHQWSGNPRAARRALLRAIEARPDHEASRDLLRHVEAALAPSVHPAITTTTDSDDSRSTIYSIEGGLAMPWGERLVAGASHRLAELGPAQGSAIVLRVATSWISPGGSWTVRGEAGGTILDGRAAPGAPRARHGEPLISARISGRPASRISVGVGASRVAFDETAPLIIAGIASTTVEGDAELRLHRRVTLSVGGGTTRLSGGSVPNDRTAASGFLRWTLAPGFSAAAGARTFGYERAATDGYFAPRRYVLAEGSVRASLGGELGWGLDAELGLGDQAITAFDDSRSSRFAQRATAALSYSPALATELSLLGGFANVASPTTIGSAEYRIWSLSLRGRFRL